MIAWTSALLTRGNGSQKCVECSRLSRLCSARYQDVESGNHGSGQEGRKLLVHRTQPNEVIKFAGCAHMLSKVDCPVASRDVRDGNVQSAAVRQRRIDKR